MKALSSVLAVLIAAALVVGGCGKSGPAEVELQRFSLDNLEGIIAMSGIEVDPGVSADGMGSLRIDAAAPVHIRLLELNNVDIEKAVLIYRAKLRAENLNGRAYLEMWCRFPGMGEYFSRDLETPLSGSVNWTSEETPFFIKEGQNPDLVKLNLVVEGTGTVWIDDIHLVKGALP